MKKIFFTIAACANLTFLPAQIINVTEQGYRVEGERLAQKGMSNLAYALDGVFPGVQVVRENVNGQTIAKLTYHGTASALLDMAVYINGTEYVGSLDLINVNDIESVTLLREGQNVIYGHRAAEGIILIEMKKAKASKFSLTFQNQTGITTKALPYYEVLNDPAQMAELIWEREYMGGFGANGASQSALLNPDIWYCYLKNGDYILPYRLPFQVEGYLVETDGKINPDAKLLWHDKWRKEMVSAGFRQENHLAVSGGDKLLNARGAFGYVHEDGYLDATGVNRFNGLLSLRSQPVAWLKTGVDLQAALHDSKQREADYYYVHHDSPFRPIYNRTKTGEKEKINNSDYLLPVNLRYPYYNAMMTDSTGRTTRTEKMVAGNVFAEFKYKGLYGGVKVSGIWWRRETINKYESFALKSENVADRKLNKVSSLQYAGWKGSFDNNHIAVSLSHEDLYHDGYNLRSQSFRDYYSSFDKISLLDNQKEEMIHGYNWSFGANYDYDHRFIAYANVLIEEQPYFFEFQNKPISMSTYYKAGAQWNLWRTSFSDSLLSGDVSVDKNPAGKILNQLSLFADWGLMKPNEYKRQEIFGFLPEEFLFFTTGFHSELFNRTKLSVSYFQRRVNNLVGQEGLLPSSGYMDRYRNSYSVRTSGVDMNLQVDILKTKVCTWQLGLNLSHYRQIVKSDEIHADGLFAMTGTDLHRYVRGYEKYELGLNYGEFYKTGEQKADKKPEPDLFGGFSSSLRFKKFDLNLGLTYAIGGWVYDQTYMSLLDGEQLVWHKDMEHRWRPGADNKDAGMPNLQASNLNNPYVLTSASFLSLDYINLGYNFDKQLLRKLGIAGLRVSLIGDNLFLISARKGFDPRSVPGYGFKQDSDRYIKNYSYAESVPLLRTFSLGLTMTL